MMKTRFYIWLLSMTALVPAQGLAEEVPTALDLCKKMYESRMAIEEMKATVTIRKPVKTTFKPSETETTIYLLQCSRNMFRSDKTNSFEGKKSKFQQYIQTPSLYFLRNPYNSTGRNNGDSTIFWNKDTGKQYSCYDPRQLGLVVASLDVLPTTLFDYETVRSTFYPPKGVDFKVVRDEVDGEKLWKVSYKIATPAISNSYWIDDQKGYNLVRLDSKYDTRDVKLDFSVQLQKYKTPKGDVWFPKETTYDYRNGPNDQMIEVVKIEDVSFKIDDDKTFTLAGLDLPIGHEVLVDGEFVKYWDGQSLVDFIPHAAPRPAGKKLFWIINGILLALIALALYRRSLHRRSDKTSLT